MVDSPKLDWHQYYEPLATLATPFDLMKFTLTFDGDLRATGNHGKPADVMAIRNAFHQQLKDLWESHVIIRQLARTARTRIIIGAWLGTAKSPDRLPEYKEPIQPLPEGHTDFCAPIQVPNSAAYIPLIRESLYLACALDIHFLRHGDPGELVTQGGDLDGRIKTLFDALRMPNEAEERAAGPPLKNPCYCLLQSDTLISDLSVKTGRLLGYSENPQQEPHAVRLTIDVTVKVLRVMEQNQCLIGE